MPINFPFTDAYHVPFRVLWLQGSDSVALRITLSGRPQEEVVHKVPVQCYLDASTGRLLGIGVADSKVLRLGAWLRQNWETTPLDQGEPIPFGTAVYDQGGQFAYFSVWPDLNDAEIEQIERRRAEVTLNEKGELLRVRFPVSLRRRQDGLSSAVGYLATR